MSVPFQLSPKSLWDETVDGPWPSQVGDDGSEWLWGVILVPSTLLWLLAVIVPFSDLALDLMLGFLLCGWGVLIGSGWFAWTIQLFGRGPRSRSRREVYQWAVVMLAGMLGFALFVSDDDTSLRIKLSEPDLMRCLAETRPKGRRFAESRGRPVGSFRFRSIVDTGQEVHLQSVWPADPATTLIYSPSGPPRRVSSEHQYRHYYGPWYSFAFTQSF